MTSNRSSSNVVPVWEFYKSYGPYLMLEFYVKPYSCTKGDNSCIKRFLNDIVLVLTDKFLPCRVLCIDMQYSQNVCLNQLQGM